MKTNTLRMESSNPEGLLNRGSCEMTKYSKNTNCTGKSQLWIVKMLKYKKNILYDV